MPTQLSIGQMGNNSVGNSQLTDDSVDSDELAPGGTGITGEIKMWPFATPPTGFLNTAIPAVSRTTYAALFAVIATTVNGTTTSSSAIITGLSGMTGLPIGAPVSGTGIPNGSVILTVDSDTQITLDQNATASATVAVTVAPYGTGDHSTTFDLPDFQGRVPVGVGTGDATNATAFALADKDGDESTLLTGQQSGIQTHTHDVGGSTNGATGGGSLFVGSAATTQSSSTGDTNAVDRHTNLQPSLGIHFIIKT